MALRQREEKAIESLVKTYTRELCRAAQGLGFDETSAVELVQSVWATFFEKVNTFEGRSHVRTYIFGILYNKAKELRRDKFKHTTLDPFDQAMGHLFDSTGHWAKPPESPEKFLEATQTTEIIETCLQGLPTNQRMAFYMKEVEGSSTSEICKILQVTATNLGVLLYRAKHRLRDCIESKMK